MTASDIPTARDLIELARRLSVAQYDMVRAAAAFAAGKAWHDEAPTAAHWLADHLDIHLGTAREWIRIGGALNDLPAIDQAFGEQRLSYSKVRALTRTATPENEKELLAIAETVPASELSIALSQWLTNHEDPEKRDSRHRRCRRLTTWVDHDGMVAGFFRLTPEQAGGFLAAIQAAVQRLAQRRRPSGDASADERSWPSLPQQRADALVDLVTGGGVKQTSEIVIHVRGDGCSLDDGTPLTTTVVERLAPEAFFRALVHDADQRPVNASFRRRRPSDRQRRVVKERDRTCVDCGSTDLLEYDHSPEYATSRQTSVDELELRCAPCHHQRHEEAA